MAYNYYQSELNKVKVGLTEYSPTIKVFANGNGDNTKNLDLNERSAKELINWLTKNFIKGNSALTLFNIMIEDKSIALNESGAEFWKSHKRKVWKIQNISEDRLTVVDPNTHQIFEGVDFEHIKQ